MIKSPSAQIYQKEREALDTVPRPLRPDKGEERYQRALESDLVYRWALLAAAAMAFCAGTGFGRLSLAAGWLTAALAGVIGAGISWALIAPRRVGREASDSRQLLRALQLLAGLTAVFALLGGFAGGEPLVSWLGLAFGFSVFYWVCARFPLFTLTLVHALGLTVAMPQAILGEEIAFPALYFCVVAWAVAGTAQVVESWQRFFLVALGVTTLVALLWRVALRRSFVPAVATVIVLHLAGGLYAEARLHAPLGPQAAALGVEFVLLAIAGYRHSLASLLRLPLATYRSAPLSVVPRLDRAQDFPLKIDVT